VQICGERRRTGGIKQGQEGGDEMEFSGGSEEELREYRSYRRRPGGIRLSAAVDFSAEARPVIGGVRV
jgi:hypothetical protein